MAAVVADARSLRQRGVAVQQVPPTLLAREVFVSPCAAWLQEHAGQLPAAVAAGGPPPCPCLVTPAPLMTAEQTQAVEVQAAADNAMFKGLTRIQEAALEAAGPLKKEIEALNVKEIEEAAKTSLEAVEQNQTGNLKLALQEERSRQEMEMADMEAGANMVAKVGADHLRETAEQWAENQARNYIVMSANGTMADALQTAEKTNLIRQESTELVKGAIKSADQSLKVAKRAQLAIDELPKEKMLFKMNYTGYHRPDSRDSVAALLHNLTTIVGSDWEARALVEDKQGQELNPHAEIPEDKFPITVMLMDVMKTAEKRAQKSKEEQQKLNEQIETVEHQVRQIAQMAQMQYVTATNTLKEADEAEAVAKEALATSRSNAEKIQKLKDRAQVVTNKASRAQKELEKSQA